MKETILRSKKFNSLILQIFNDNEFGMLGENLLEKPIQDNGENDFFTDNKNYAYEVLKLLKEAEKRGCFDNIEEENIEEENIEEENIEEEKIEEILI